MDDDAYDRGLSEAYNDADVEISQDHARLARPGQLAQIRDLFDFLRKIAVDGVCVGSMTTYEASEIMNASRFYDDLSDELEE